MTIYFVTEHFPDDPTPIYERFREKGRMAPDGLVYINSWVTTDLKKCYQTMECEDRRLLDEWMAHWSDLVRYRTHNLAKPVLTTRTTQAPPYHLFFPNLVQPQATDDGSDGHEADCEDL
ncbi:hypothetical protein BT63DRAFT_461409 [Microthyrium microscopicum]|uniref:Uncharacterized protein n=1 Tax=Microthyrium microscopicum TaxID=703497 RepID=A0A6A6TWQ7_9PEZI|nr:hypothetical protein BT63DRAFT_461409 [Microthyrium microscopicum]